ncbi:hypothetical protein UFOVP274_48 [uncultured Caudovirales phage]|uniref:Transcriptional repressor NrdR-like N-terminal domain-containing protein n=1 Tax=uncultured Caudovirales phage TaxID=2100421 RepID=A0A6J5LP57_9CAUD|nr:hypothetical protein UFOVP274_48 [uncultured Caudovirales phage]
MMCPECNDMKSKVADSRPLTNGWTQRKRKCECGNVWYTFEVPADFCEVNPSELGAMIINRKKK